MNINQIIAENLKRLRLERNLSLGQLSALCQVSKMMLAQIEKGETNPTVNTLWKIANGLKVPYTKLMEQREHTTSILQKSHTDIFEDDDGHYRVYCYYTSTPSRNFEILQLELDSQGEYISAGHCERSEEYVMVTEGELTLTLNMQSYVLHKDDAISFIASTQHTYFSSGAETLKAVIINYYPA